MRSPTSPQGPKRFTTGLHVAAALLCAAIAPALVAALIARQPMVFFAAAVVALGHAVLLGGPLLAIAWRMRRLSWWSAAVGGAAVGAVGSTLLLWLMTSAYGSHGSHGGVTSSDGHYVQTMADGALTLAGWLQMLPIVGMAAALGVTGGLACLACLRIAGHARG